MGTAFERVYTHHLEFGTLDPFLDSLRAKTRNRPEDGSNWLLLGLFESQKGEDELAVFALRKATELRSNDPMAPYYCGLSLLRLANIDGAVEFLERAIARNPNRTDMLEIYQSLGRLYSRAQRPDDALKTWKRLESVFPDDARVLEQIAATLYEEGQYAESLPRYERLIQIVKDDYRRVAFRIQAATIQLKTEHRAQGIVALESILSDVNPSSWIFRDVRKRIEDTFLNSNDQDSLVKYYETWLQKHPDDVDAMARLAKYLSSNGRVPEGNQWMEKAIALVPSRTELRRTFVDMLIDSQRISDAILQYKQLAELAPNNLDYLRDWGRLLLKDKSRDLEDRKAETASIWNRIVSIRPNDASTASMVADLFRQSNMERNAIELYEKAIDLAPQEPQYREYLGEYFHVLNKPDQALKTWASMMEGSRHTSENVSRLAQVFKRFGFFEKAVEQIVEACRLSPKDFHLHLDAAEYHTSSGRTDDALGYLERAEKLAANDDEREMVLKRRIESYQESGRLQSEIQKLLREIRSDSNASEVDWRTLARYCEAARRWPLAKEAIKEALRRNPNSVASLAAATKIAETSGDFAMAIQRSKQLIALDRRATGEYLTNIARYEAQIGHSEAAVQAAKQLIQFAPGNTDHYEFLAQMCFRVGRVDDGLDALRRAIRINPNEPRLTLLLGSALSDHGKQSEAIEIFWRAFEKTEDLDDKTSLILKMVPLYSVKKQSNALIEKLKQLHRGEDDRRIRSICLAQAYSAIQEHGLAKQELESLFAQDTRDTNLLQQLAKICESAKDLETAIQYQRQLVAIAPGAETEMPLARMLQSQGVTDEAEEILLRLALRDDDPQRVLKTIDSLLAQMSFDSIFKITRPRLEQQRDNWELLYREAIALILQENTQEAMKRMEQLLSIGLPHDTLSHSEDLKVKKSQAKAKSNNLQGSVTQVPIRPTYFDMTATRTAALAAMNIDTTRWLTLPASTRSRLLWVPTSFGQARVAAYAWLNKWNSQHPAIGEVAQLRSAMEESLEAVSRERVLDYFYLSVIQSNSAELFRVSRMLAKLGGSEEQELFLNMLSQREQKTVVAPGNNAFNAVRQPLNEEDIVLMLSCYESLPKVKRTNPLSTGQMPSSVSIQTAIAMSGSSMSASQLSQLQQLAAQQSTSLGTYNAVTQTTSQSNATTLALARLLPTGQTSAPAAVRSMSTLNSTYFDIVIVELELAAKSEQAEKLVLQLVDQATTISEWQAFADYCLDRGRLDLLQKHGTNWISTVESSLAATNSLNTIDRFAAQICRWVGALHDKAKPDEIFELIEPALNIACVYEQIVRKNGARASIMQQTSNRVLKSYPVTLPSFFGSEVRNISFDMPGLDQVIQRPSIQMVRQFYDALTALNLKEKFKERLLHVSDNRKETNDVSFLLFLAMVHWWDNDFTAAVDRMTTALKGFNEDPSLRLGLVAALEHMRDHDRAWKVLNEIDAFEPSVQFRRDWLTMQIGWRVGEKRIAAEAAERISAMNVDRNTGLELVEMLLRLGKEELAESMQKKLTRATTLQTSRTAATRIAPRTTGSAQNQVRTSEIQNAKAILARPRSTSTTPAASSLSPGAGPSRDVRLRALETLRKLNELDKMIEELETKFSKAPATFREFESLFEFYSFIGQPSKIYAVFEKAIEADPDNKLNQILFAKTLKETGQENKACDLFGQLLRDDPNCLNSKMDYVISAFRGHNRLDEIKDQLKKVNVSEIRGIVEQSSFLNLLATIDEEATLREFRRIYEQFPNYQINYLASLKVSDSLARKVIPILCEGFAPANKAKVNEWRGWSESPQSNRDINRSLIPAILRFVRSSDLPLLRAGIEEQYRSTPDWFGGKLFLSLIDLQNPTMDPQIVTQSMKEILNTDVIASIPPFVCENIASEFEKHAVAIPLAWPLLERAALYKSFSQQFDQNSPIAKLVNWSIALHTEERTAELLRKQFDSTINSLKPLSGSNLNAIDIQKVEHGLWIADKQIVIGFPLDAMRSCETLMHHSAVILSVTPRSTTQTSSVGRETQNYKRRCQEIQNRALAAIDHLELEKMIGQFTRKDRVPRIDFSLSKLDSIPAEDVAIQSNWLQILSRIVELKPPLPADQQLARAQKLDEHLSTLYASNSEDSSLLIASALLRLKYKCGDVRSSFQGILDLLNSIKQSDDGLPDRKSKNAMDHDLELFKSIWLVASQCWQDSSERSMGDQLGAAILDYAIRTENRQLATAVMFDWSHRLWNLGDRPSAQQKFKEAVAHIAGAKAGEDLLDQINDERPLSKLQFDWYIAASEAANHFEMFELSRKLFRRSLIGGLPYSDEPSNTPAGISGGMAIYTTQTANGTTVSVPVQTGSAVATQPAQVLRFETDAICRAAEVAEAWQESKHSAEDVYHVLREVILSNPRQLMASSLTSARLGRPPQSLAASLVLWAKRSKHLDDLDAEVSSRLKNATVFSMQLFASIRDLINKAREIE